MPPSTTKQKQKHKKSRKCKKPGPKLSSSAASAAKPAATVDLSLLWKAAFCPLGQLRRSQWLRVDLAAGLRAIQRELQESEEGDEISGSRVSLSYLSTVYLGLCRIMACQVHHYCRNVSLPRLDFELLSRQQAARGRRGRKSTNDDEAGCSFQQQFQATDPMLREFAETCAQIEAFKVQHQQQQQQKTGENTGAHQLASLLSSSQSKQVVETNWPPGSVNEHQSEASDYFEGLYGQLNSVNFEEECTELMEKHFSTGGGKRKKKNQPGSTTDESDDDESDTASSAPKRFAELHRNEEMLPLTGAAIVPSNTDGYEMNLVEEDAYEPPVELLMSAAAAEEVKEELAKEEASASATKLVSEPSASATKLVSEPSTIAEVATELPMLPADAPEINSEPVVAFKVPLTVAHLLASKERPQSGRARRRRGNKRRRRPARGKRLSGLALHLQDYCKSKNGYQAALEESADSGLTEPSRSMCEQLTEHFAPAEVAVPTTATDSSILQWPEQQEEEGQNQDALPEVAEQQQPSPLVAEDNDCTQVAMTSSASPFDSLPSPSIKPPSVNAEEEENAGFHRTVESLDACAVFEMQNQQQQSEPQEVQSTASLKQPQLKRQAIPVVKDYRAQSQGGQVKAAENEVVSAEKISDTSGAQILSVLRAALAESQSTTAELPFTELVQHSNCGQNPPSRQKVALTFCSLLSLSAQQPNSGVKLHDRKNKDKKLSAFSDLTITLTKQSASSSPSGQ